MFFTQNPIGSSATEDLQDNAISFDYAMNSPAALWQDRFGKQHKTVQQALKDVGFKPAGFDFVSGGTLGIGDRDKCVFYPTDGYWYSWNGKLPYVVPANSSPTPGGKKGWGVNTTFDTARTIKTAGLIRETNQFLGEIVHTNGYYREGDGGGATFVVKSTGIENGVTVIKTLNNLYCHMVNDERYTFDPFLADTSEFVTPAPFGGSIVNGNNLVQDLSIQPLKINTRAHKGLSSFAMEMNDESFIVLTREAGVHSEDKLGLIRCYRSVFGSRDMTWGYQTTAQNTLDVDDRDAAVGYMFGNRVGIIGSNNAQWSYSDDNGLSWTTKPTGLTNHIGFVDKIHPYPGGGDKAFIAFGTDYSDVNGERKMTAIKTLNNGETWSTQILITDLPESTSEWTITRIGNNDFWIATARQNGDGRPPVYFKSVDMITWEKFGNSTLAMGANPSTIFYHEGFIYQFITFRNRAWTNAQPKQAYKGKVVWSRTPAWKALNGDVSDLDDIKVLISLDNALGYFRFMKSPISGRVHATVATRELYTLVGGGEVKDGFPMYSDLLLLTNEKLSTSQTLPDNFIAPVDTGGLLWRVSYDRTGNTMTGFTTIKISGNGTSLIDRLVKLPKDFHLDTIDDYAIALTVTTSSLSTLEPVKYLGVTTKTVNGFTVRSQFKDLQQIENFITIDITINAFGYYPRIT